jgi:CDP-L-myo-inositol myo-inositolphosphotransferase
MRLHEELQHEGVGLETATPPAVILAAGEGRRLRDDPRKAPKPLRRILGVTLAERCIAQMQAAGVDRFIVVLGYEASRVRAHFEKLARRRRCEITFVVADNWRGGNGFSAAAAAPLAGERFLLTMTDHLLSPEIIRRVLMAPPRRGEVVLAVDRDLESVFDLADLTKVRLAGDRVADIGKDLAEWDAGDTGLFYCTPALFEGLERARRLGGGSLGDGIRECARRGLVRAVDVSGIEWLDVDTPAAHREAVGRMKKGLSKGGEDGFVSQYINRPISRRLSMLLAHTPLTPNQISLASFTLALLGAAGLAGTAGIWWVAGGLLIQLASILDGCDGEIARLKLLRSSRGAWLDTMMDRYADIAIGIAVTFSAMRLYASPAVWLGGLLAITGFLLASYVTKEFQLRFGQAYPDNVVNRLKRRDLRVLAVAVGALVGLPFAALLAVGALSHAAVLLILFTGPRTGQAVRWRLAHEGGAGLPAERASLEPAPILRLQHRGGGTGSGWGWSRRPLN